MNASVQQGQLNQLPLKPFLENIHSLRALVIFLIVSGHVLGRFPWQDAGSLQWLLDILENGSVMFVFVAGFLFQHLSARYQYRDYLLKKIAQVIVPYLVVATPAVMEAIVWQDYLELYPQLTGHSIGYHILWFYIKGGADVNFALWFIPMITLFYVVAPIFMQFIKRPYWYGLIVPLIVLSLLIKRPAYPNLDTLHLVIYMFPAYLLGMCTSQFGAQVLRPLQNRPVLNGGLVLLVWALPLLVDAHNGNYEESGYFTFDVGWVDWLFAQKLLLAVLLTVAFKHLPMQCHRCLAPIAQSSFAIFFVHAYWIFIVEHLLGRIYLQASVALWLIMSLIILSLSFFTAMVVKKIWPRHSPYLMGY